ncbi:MAG TPA: hypothetical protein EYF95_03615 [Flavobacteriales bacterium]|jgi:hypothetical protein|nr:hypothetical protein [Flavobacteriales bacterium]
MKKRLNKYEKALIENIQTVQLRSLKRLKERAKYLLTIVEDLIKKIEADGISRHYSQNSDCLRIAEDVWKESLRLGEMKRLEDDIRGSFMSLTKKKNKSKDT